MSPLPYVVALALVALGCGVQGVSLGSEEACVTDPRLRAAQDGSGSAPLPTCATIGQNQLVNPGMESPPIATIDSCVISFCQVDASRVLGWRTTSEAQVIEVWTDGYWDVPAAEGAQFVELDADTPDTLYQDVVLTPGEPVYWSVRHRGRLGEEEIEVSVGPPQSPALQGSFITSNRAWQQYDGIYQVGENETVTRFAIASRTGTTEGNLLDDAVLAPIEVAR